MSDCLTQQDLDHYHELRHELAVIEGKVEKRVEHLIKKWNEIHGKKDASTLVV